jgi:hypothetical protein
MFKVFEKWFNHFPDWEARDIFIALIYFLSLYPSATEVPQSCSKFDNFYIKFTDLFFYQNVIRISMP